MGLLDKQKVLAEANIRKSLSVDEFSPIVEEEYLSKGGKRTGMYQDNATNRAKHRVGQKYSKDGQERLDAAAEGLKGQLERAKKALAQASGDKKIRIEADIANFESKLKRVGAVNRAGEANKAEKKVGKEKSVTMTNKHGNTNTFVHHEGEWKVKVGGEYSKVSQGVQDRAAKMHGDGKKGEVSAGKKRLKDYQKKDDAVMEVLTKEERTKARKEWNAAGAKVDWNEFLAKKASEKKSSLSDKIPKELDKFAKIAKIAHDVKDFMSLIRKITDVSPKVSQLFMDKYGSKDGKQVSIEQASKNFIAAVGKDSKYDEPDPSKNKHPKYGGLGMAQVGDKVKLKTKTGGTQGTVSEITTNGKYIPLFIDSLGDFVSWIGD